MGDDNFTRGRLEGLAADLSRVTQMLLGDGQPGILERQVRIEENTEQVIELARKNAGAIHDLTKAVHELHVSLQLHGNDPMIHSWRMLLNYKIICAFLVIYILLYSIAEYLPNGIGFLWGLLAQ